MDWSPQQDAALKAVDAWAHDASRQVFYLAGYAGTGKTTLAKHFAEAVGGGVLFGAYTGKAAHVLVKKGCEGASTIHSMIYRPKKRSTAEIDKLKALETETWNKLRKQLGPDADLSRHPEIQKIKAKLRQKGQEGGPLFSKDESSAVADADMVIIDECSMVDQRIGEDLLSFKKKVLVLGDPAQLPPVYGAGYFTNRRPDFLLTEIHRQARDNPIIEMARLVREGRELKVGKYGDSEVIPRSGSTPGLALTADQILVGRNKTRQACNARVRTLLGRTATLPVPKDKLVCLRNNHDIGLLNGSIWKVDGAVDLGDDTVSLNLTSDDDDEIKVDTVSWKNHFERREAPAWWDKENADEFDYGYALTVHKAQGSQWNDLLLFDEWYNQGRKEWLYTGITRAAERVVIVQM